MPPDARAQRRPAPAGNARRDCAFFLNSPERTGIVLSTLHSIGAGFYTQKDLRARTFGCNIAINECAPVVLPRHRPESNRDFGLRIADLANRHTFTMVLSAANALRARRQPKFAEPASRRTESPGLSVAFAIPGDDVLRVFFASSRLCGESPASTHREAAKEILSVSIHPTMRRDAASTAEAGNVCRAPGSHRSWESGRSARVSPA